MIISEVVIILDLAGQKALKDVLEAEEKDSRFFKLFTEETDDKRLSPSEEVMLFSWSNIQWSYDHKDFFEKVIKDLDEENYYFARMGEDYGDFEYDGELNRPFAIYPKQELDLDVYKEVP